MITATVAAQAQESETKADPQVMLLGSHHLANNNRDLINLGIEDVLAPRRQREIETLVGCLARWKPTRIAIEWDRSDQAGLDQRYASYLAGNLEPTANERDQIGLRLAKLLGHDRVYAADWNEAPPGSEEAYDFIGWAERNNQSGRLQAVIASGQQEADRKSAEMRDQSVSEWYLSLNDPAAVRAMHRAYFDIATFGSNADNPGAAWVGSWYARNLRILNNIREISSPGQRVLVLYGAGHIHLLGQFLEESGAAQRVDPRPAITCQPAVS
ncbi:MAG: DUF5694 domain-containing protein [Erythrobacter sp.]